MEYHTEQIHLEAADIAGVAEVAAQTGQNIEDVYRAVIKAGVAALVLTNVTNVQAAQPVPDANVTNVQAAQPVPVDPVAASQDAAIAQAQAALDAAVAAKAATQPAATV